MFEHTMYTIKQASARTGVGAPLIRAWERRYGVVSPARTASGYRLYDETAIAVLQTMRGLVDSGWTASEAARAIGAGEVPVDGTASPDAPVHAAPAAPAVVDAGASRRAALIGRFVAAAASSSPAETEATLDEILAAGSFEAVVDDLLLPAVAALGDAWAAGTLGVAAEHAASAAVVRRLAAVYQAAGVPARAAVVVGLPPGSRHEIGALAFAAALRRRGVGVLYLGQDVTVDGWRDVVDRTRARAAIVGVVTASDRPAAAAVIAGLHAGGVPMVAVGGAAATDDVAPGERVTVLPGRVVDAARVVAEAVGRRR
jgi:MerR family transcriptional regulator, light-induced transcriptional regulator